MCRHDFLLPCTGPQQCGVRRGRGRIYPAGTAPQAEDPDPGRERNRLKCLCSVHHHHFRALCWQHAAGVLGVPVCMLCSGFHVRLDVAQVIRSERALDFLLPSSILQTLAKYKDRMPNADVVIWTGDSAAPKSFWEEPPPVRLAHHT